MMESPGQLDFSTNTNIMFNMKTFTVREPDCKSAAALDAADKEGFAHIKRRDGRLYTILPVTPAKKITAMPDFQARIKRIFPKPIPKSQARMFDKLLAGE